MSGDRNLIFFIIIGALFVSGYYFIWENFDRQVAAVIGTKYSDTQRTQNLWFDTNPQCYIPACRTFSSDRVRVNNPYSKTPLEWKRIMQKPEVRRIFDELYTQITIWLNNVGCPEECPTVLRHPTKYIFHVEPVETVSGSCSSAGQSQTHHISVEETAAGPGRCIIAAMNAGNTAKNQINSFQNSCGGSCGTSLDVSNLNFTKEDHGFLEGCRVTAEADVVITCVDKPVAQEFYVWIEAVSCITCIGLPTQTKGASD
jgi:hypothetical protein